MIDTENHGFQGLWIPAALWMDESLSLLEKAIIADVLSFDKYYKSNAKMAKFFGVKKRWLQQVLSNMEEKGLIVCITTATESGRTLGRIIKLSWAYHQKLYPRPFPYEEESRGAEKCTGRVQDNAREGAEKCTPYIKNTNKNTERDITTASNSSSHSSTKRKATKKEEEGRRGKKYFTPPEYDEVARYVAEHGYQVDAYEFWSFYERRDWKANGKPVMDWRKCLDKWEESEKVKDAFVRINQAMMDALNDGELEKAIMEAARDEGRDFEETDEWGDD